MTTILESQFDQRLFRSVLGKFASGVTVLGYHCDGQFAGLTASAFISVSLDPPLVLVSVRSQSRFLTCIDIGTRFGISFLSENQHEVSNHFGGRPADIALPFELWRDVPIVSGGLAGIAARVVDLRQAGDHHLVISEVEHLFETGNKPLLYFGGGYHRLEVA